MFPYDGTRGTVDAASLRETRGIRERLREIGVSEPVSVAL